MGQYGPSRAVPEIIGPPRPNPLPNPDHRRQPDGRGVARRPDPKVPGAGKAIFVAGALPGETVMAQQTARHRSFDEAKTLEVLVASPDRVPARCPHFGVCGGCALQHLDEAKQIHVKQRVLLDNLERIGHVTPESVLPPLVDAAWGYRRKGRFSVRRVEKKDKTLVGFREQDPRFVADLHECHTVIPQIGMKIAALSALVDGMDGRRDIPQIEFIAGDRHHRARLPPPATAVAARYAGAGRLREGARFRDLPAARRHRFGARVVAAPAEAVLHAAGVEYRTAVPSARLHPGQRGPEPAHDRQRTFAARRQPGERVLDLFCGLGNFTLPLARTAGEVVGVEGDAGLIRRARENATHNQLANVDFHAADLAQDLASHAWMRAGFDRLLLDPPRSGADVVLKQLNLDGLKRIVYVSCHPGSLARDAGTW
jgi:23S rRNA (uracil1939-C5)-methyltransferase